MTLRNRGWHAWRTHVRSAASLGDAVAPTMKLATLTVVAIAVTSMATAAPAKEVSTPIDRVAAALVPSGMFVQGGRASETTTLTLGLQWDWSREWQIGQRGRLSGYSEASIGHWRADTGGGSAIVTQLGFTPTFRFWPSGERSGLFCEGGIGANVLTPIYRTREKRFSTAFNFGDHIGAGYRLPASKWEWSLRLQHFSNAGIDHPNPGANFVQFRLLVPLGERGDS